MAPSGIGRMWSCLCFTPQLHVNMVCLLTAFNPWRSIPLLSLCVSLRCSYASLPLTAVCSNELSTFTPVKSEQTTRTHHDAEAPQFRAGVFQANNASKQLFFFWPVPASVRALTHTAGMPTDLLLGAGVGGRKLEQRQRRDFEGNSWNWSGMRVLTQTVQCSVVKGQG